MSTTCPRCGVELAALVDPSEHFEQVGGRYVRHDAERCRDRLAARVAELEKRAEGAEAALSLQTDRVIRAEATIAWLSAENALLWRFYERSEASDAALERLITKKLTARRETEKKT